MALKVHIRPSPREVRSDHGIGRVVHAQFRHLESFDIELVGPDAAADIYAGHTQQFDMPRVDILHCHGLYWSGDPNSGRYTGWHHGVNLKIVEAARSAAAITVPSDWVAGPFRRDMRISPIIIGHGIEVKEWKPGKPKGYVLWNKNRDSDVCDPTPAWELANRGASVVSTFGINKPQPSTLQVVGRLPAAQMKETIRHASVYLATTKETFGIGTLEAMAAGCPVLGYSWGGTADIVENGVTGWLVQPGDIEGLHKGLEIVLSRRAEMGEAARAATQAYDWSQIIERYADVYRGVYSEIYSQPQGVSVVITCHNYARYVGAAIESVQKQTIAPVEIIVVDDGSTDDSLQVIRKCAVSDTRIKVIAQSNRGVAAARSAGIGAATQAYVVCLDADDRIESPFVETLLPALRADRSLGIVYSGLSVNYPDGGRSTPKDWPPAFSWESQTAVSNPPSSCIPSACLFRKSMWQRAGPHKQEYAPGEDTEFWTRGLSVGFKAKRVTTDPLFWYRAHPASASRTKTYRPIDDRLPWMRDRQFPMGVPLVDSIPPIRSYSDPLISVIIPVGPGHARYLPDALDSLLGQTLREWEVIVVDDTRKVIEGPKGQAIEYHTEIDIATLRPYPFARLVASDGQHTGAAAARNVGLRQATAPLVLFLDADDVLMPNALAEFVRGYIAGGGKYVYSDYYVLRESGAPIPGQSADYKQQVWLNDDLHIGLHAVSALVPREWLIDAGGFDPELVGWEEGDLFTRLALRGYCGIRHPQPLLVYREYSGNGRTRSNADSTRIVNQMRARYGSTLSGAQAMASCCGGNGNTIQQAKAVLDRMPKEIKAVDKSTPAGPQTVRMEYVGRRVGAITFFGQKREYQGGNNPTDRYADVDPADVAKLESSGQWKRVVVLPVTVRPDQARPPQWDEKAEPATPLPLTELEKALFGDIPIGSNGGQFGEKSIDSLSETIAAEVVDEVTPDVIEEHILSDLPKSKRKTNGTQRRKRRSRREKAIA